MVLEKGRLIWEAASGEHIHLNINFRVSNKKILKNLLTNKSLQGNFIK